MVFLLVLGGGALIVASADRFLVTIGWVAVMGGLAYGVWWVRLYLPDALRAVGLAVLVVIWAFALIVPYRALTAGVETYVDVGIVMNPERKFVESDMLRAGYKDTARKILAAMFTNIP